MQFGCGFLIFKVFFTLNVKMEENEIHFHHLSLSYFQKEQENAVQTVKTLGVVYWDSAIAESTFHN